MAASVPARDVQTKVSSEAAQNFVEAYYRALNENRPTLANFYVKADPAAAVKPDISLNGNIIEDGVKVQEIFVSQMPKSRYEVQAFDCQVVNANYNANVVDDKDLGPEKDGSKMSIMVLVSGFVKYGDNKDTAMKGFSETFLLIPNRETQGPKGKARAGRKWLIQSQNFRLVL